MINPKNSLVLAFTKLKARKIRTIITVVISSLLFSLLFLAVILFEGALTVSLTKFSEGSLSARHMLSFNPSTLYNIVSSEVTPEEKTKLDQMLNDEIAARKKRAKELGIEFDEKSERQRIMPYVNYNEQDPNALSFQAGVSVIANRYLNEKSKTRFEEYYKSAERVAKLTNAEKFGYEFVLAMGGMGGGQYATFLPDAKTGKYQFIKAQDNKLESPEQAPTLEQSLLISMQASHEEIYRHFVFQNHGWTPETGKVPIILTLDNVQSLLGMKPLGRKATLNERLARLKELKERALGLEYKACYLNSVAQRQLSEAQNYDKMTAEEKKNVSLAYGKLDGSACVAPAVIKDTRSKEEKAMALKQAQFQQEFDGTEYQGTATEITFQVVGVSPASSNYNMANQEFIDNIIQQIIGYSSFGNMVPADWLMKLPTFSKVMQIYNNTAFDMDKKQPILNFYSYGLTFFAEYSKPELVRAAVDNYACDPAGMTMFIGRGDFYPESCSGDRQFYMMTFGSRAADLITVKAHFLNVIKIAGLIFGAIAIVIMAGTVGRLISDSRRETAVFRAIGFKRFDISSIYINYSLVICLLVIAVAFGLAMLAAKILELSLTDELTSQMIWIYSPQNPNLRFELLGFNWPLLGTIAAGIVLVGLISTVFPLLRNVGRNPIKDMRDE